MKNLITLLAICLSITSFSQIPNLIPYQGQIADTSGKPYNGSFDFEFKINDGSSTLWSSGSMNLEVFNGAYSVVLGASPQPSLSSSIWANDLIYLEVSFDDGVNGMETLSPDVQILAVPYALRAAYADSSRSSSSLQDGDSLVLRDINGDVRFVLNPNTGTFKVLNNDTIWYSMRVNSPPVEKYEYNGQIVEKYDFGNSTITTYSNKHTGKRSKQETNTNNPDGSSQTTISHYDKNGDLVRVKTLKLDVNNKLCQEYRTYSDGKLIEETTKKDFKEEKKQYHNGILVLHHKDTAHFRIIEHFDTTSGKLTYTEKRTVGAYAESYDFEIRDSTGNIIGWRNENMRNNSSTYRDVASGRFIVVEPGTLVLESPTSKLVVTPERTDRETGGLKVTERLSADGKSWIKEVTDTATGKVISTHSTPDLTKWAVDADGNFVQITNHSMEMEAANMGLKIDMDLGNENAKIEVRDSADLLLPLIFPGPVFTDIFSTNWLITDSFEVPLLRLTDPSNPLSGWDWTLPGGILTGTHNTGNIFEHDLVFPGEFTTRHIFNNDTIVLTKVPEDDLRRLRGVKTDEIETDEDGHSTVYEYDDNSNVVRIEEENDPETGTRTYDGLSRLVRELDSTGTNEYTDTNTGKSIIEGWDPLGGTQTYDGLDRQVRRVDAKGNSELHVFDNSPNPNDTLTENNNPSTQTRTYDGYDRVIFRGDAVEHAWENDATGHFVKETINTSDSSKTVQGLNKVEHTNEWIRHVVNMEAGRTVGVDYSKQTGDSIKITKTPGDKSRTTEGVVKEVYQVDSLLHVDVNQLGGAGSISTTFDPVNGVFARSGMQMYLMEFPQVSYSMFNPIGSGVVMAFDAPSTGDSIGFIIQPEIRQLQLVSPQGPTALFLDTLFSNGFIGLNGQMVIQGNLDVLGNVSKLGGSFRIDHPLDPYNKYLVHSFVESPDMMNVYNGNIVTDANGDATITLPSYFQSLNMEYRYQLTCIGSFAQAVVWEEIENNQFKIKTDKPNVKVSWQVTGIRKDDYANENRLEVEQEKEQKMKGKLLYQPISNP
ncbi:MAG: RHS repeat protein [Bacteroidia bacterium]